jgi:hypothetical protein
LIIDALSAELPIQEIVEPASFLITLFQPLLMASSASEMLCRPAKTAMTVAVTAIGSAF